MKCKSRAEDRNKIVKILSKRKNHWVKAEFFKEQGITSLCQHITRLRKMGYRIINKYEWVGRNKYSWYCYRGRKEIDNVCR